MKVLHCCLSCFYIDSYTYQENMLVKEHVKEGHNVLVVASTESYDPEGKLCYLQPSEYLGSDGAVVIRLPYVKYLPHFLAKKIRAYAGLREIVQNFTPDVIVFHGPCAFDLLVISDYVANNSTATLYVDSHEDFNNSATNFLSRWLLYKLFYKPIIQFCKKNVSKFMYITHETELFCKQVYGLVDSELEYFPLGGDILDDGLYTKIRDNYRIELGVNYENTVFVQTGKFDKKKKLKFSLNEFYKIKNRNFRFIIAGSIPEEFYEEILSLINRDSRVTFLGWVDSTTLNSLLCAADVYLQPGSQSATLQLSIASRCAVIVDDVKSHHVLCKNNGFLLNENFSLFDAFTTLADHPNLVTEMCDASFMLAKEKLDYSRLANRLLN